MVGFVWYSLLVWLCWLRYKTENKPTPHCTHFISTVWTKRRQFCFSFFFQTTKYRWTGIFGVCIYCMSRTNFLPSHNTFRISNLNLMYWKFLFFVFCLLLLKYLAKQYKRKLLYNEGRRRTVWNITIEFKPFWALKRTIQ